MKYISMIMLLILMSVSSNYVYSQNENGSSKEVICPCLLEYDFNSDIKESLNAGNNFHPVLKFTSAEIKDGMMICNYDKTFYKLNGSSAFEFINTENLSDKWITNGVTKINYYGSQNFETSILSYIYGDISSAQLDDNLKSFSLADSVSATLYLKSGGELKLNEAQNGFLITRSSIIQMKALAPVSNVPTTLGRKKNNTAPDKLK